MEAADTKPTASGINSGITDSRSNCIQETVSSPHRHSGSVAELANKQNSVESKMGANVTATGDATSASAFTTSTTTDTTVSIEAADTDLEAQAILQTAKTQVAAEADCKDKAEFSSPGLEQLAFDGLEPMPMPHLRRTANGEVAALVNQPALTRGIRLGQQLPSPGAYRAALGSSLRRNDDLDLALVGAVSEATFPDQQPQLSNSQSALQNANSTVTTRFTF
ncbi:expressed unknown protein [Seminavis robusta]|uniref:Uncharacterized protein n=1 Tax=Seminavis robusta TaxID=568900 RepID=A0A9N8HCN9_9STRA|nr:expressed unknown protein [Seminavis robusta]|eukprot:Sro227_g092190.1 n/a (222) ;mRNA; r:17266-18059